MAQQNQDNAAYMSFLEALNDLLTDYEISRLGMS